MVTNISGARLITMQLCGRWKPELEQSLEKGGSASPEIAAAWARELGQRVAAYDRGETQAEDADVVLRRMRHFLAEHRCRKAEL